MLVPKDTNGNNAAIKKNLEVAFVQKDDLKIRKHQLFSIFKKSAEIIDLPINIKA